jgi:hypothetical protein
MMSIRSTSFSPNTEPMSETKVAPITQVDLSFLSEGLLISPPYYQHPFRPYRTVLVHFAFPIFMV